MCNLKGFFERLFKDIDHNKCDCIVRFIFSIIYVAIGIVFSFLFKKWWGTDKNTVYLIMSVLFISWLFSYLCLGIPYNKYRESKIRDISLDVIGEAKEIVKLNEKISDIKDTISDVTEKVQRLEKKGK